MNTPSANRQKLLTLELGRFAAALAVVLFHYTAVIYTARGIIVFDDVFRAGHAGVAYFFVLSGFIIYHVHRNEIGQSGSVARFAWRRAVRIFPMFWMISAVMLAGFLLIPSLAGPRVLNPGGLVLDFLLLPHADAVLSISWTLRHETMFYALFALALWLGGGALWLVAVWVAISLVGAAYDLDRGSLGLLSLVASPLNLGFALGILCSIASRRLRVGRPGLWALLGSGLLLALAILEWWFGEGVPHSVVVLGIAGEVGYLVASTFMIFGLVRLESVWSMPAPGLVRILGGSSYILYLVHQPLGSALIRVMPTATTMSAAATFVILVVLAVLTALALHLAIERPILALLRPRAGTRHGTGASRET